MSEIGSFFQMDEELLESKPNGYDWIHGHEDSTYTFSGRSAIELAIKDIKRYKEVKTVYMPSYCCYSMIQPFVQNGIEVIFYKVNFNENSGLVFDIDKDQDFDIFFAMSYFGIESNQIDNIVNSIIMDDKIVIEDVTHRLLSDPSHSLGSHYCIASLRKWFAIPSGGYISKRNGMLLQKPNLDSDELVKVRIKAMNDKAEFLHNFERFNKAEILNEFKQTEGLFLNVNSDYQIDSYSYNYIKHLDINKVIDIRRDNAITLYNGIKSSDNIKLLAPNLRSFENTPLFVPIMVMNGKRDEIRQELINNKVYNPIHWPSNSYVDSDIARHELSLVCDQRYSKVDMDFQLKLINDWT